MVTFKILSWQFQAHSFMTEKRTEFITVIMMYSISGLTTVQCRDIENISTLSFAEGHLLEELNKSLTHLLNDKISI